MPKLSMNLTKAAPSSDAHVSKAKAVPEVSAMKELTSGLPSPHQSRLEAYRVAPKKHLSFSHMPVPLIDAFDAQAEALGMGKKEFLLHCMRQGGVEVPEYHEIFRQSRTVR